MRQLIAKKKVSRNAFEKVYEKAGHVLYLNLLGWLTSKDGIRLLDRMILQGHPRNASKDDCCQSFQQKYLFV